MVCSGSRRHQRADFFFKTCTLSRQKRDEHACRWSQGQGQENTKRLSIAHWWESYMHRIELLRVKRKGWWRDYRTERSPNLSCQTISTILVNLTNARIFTCLVAWNSPAVLGNELFCTLVDIWSRSSDIVLLKKSASHIHKSISKSHHLQQWDPRTAWLPRCSSGSCPGPSIPDQPRSWSPQHFWLPGPRKPQLLSPASQHHRLLA